jgi:hypothetical protein
MEFLMRQLFSALSRLFTPTPKASRVAARRRPTVRLGLEQLEKREVLSVTYNGGALIPNVQVNLLFYGQQWSTDPTLRQQEGQIEGFFKSITNSSYMDMLSEYSYGGYNIGRGSLENYLVSPSNVSTVVSDSQLQYVINYYIQQNWFAAPNGNRLYYIFTPPGVEVTTANGETSGNEPNVGHFLGYHDVLQNVPAGYYAVIPYVPAPGPMTWGIQDQVQSLTAVSSHELAEAITDADCRTGWRGYDENGTPEIGDKAAGKFGVLNGYVVQAEWSNRINNIGLPQDATWGLPAGGGVQRGPASIRDVANALTHSDEYYADFITGAYQKYLGRTPEASEVNAWVADMKNGVTDEQVEAYFIGSDEYIANHGGEGAGWVAGMYQDLLGRQATPDEVAAWVQNLENGMSPRTVAWYFAGGAEREAQRITADYYRYVGRAPEADMVPQMVAAFENGTTNEDVIAGFVGSDEYFQRQGGNNQAWLQSAFQDILNRAPTQNELDTILAEMG